MSRVFGGATGFRTSLGWLATTGAPVADTPEIRHPTSEILFKMMALEAKTPRPGTPQSSGAWRIF